MINNSKQSKKVQRGVVFCALWMCYATRCQKILQKYAENFLTNNKFIRKSEKKLNFFFLILVFLFFLSFFVSFSQKKNLKICEKLLYMCVNPSGNWKINSKQIRVVNAFRQGLDSRYGEHSTTTLAEVLRKQTSLSKRLSQASSIEYADNIPDELTIPEVDIERLSSHSHTETAV
jgi:hypothetical protein